MKSKNMIFSVDQPCSQLWEQMDQSEQGKFCSSCQKTVIDFTEMSDRELVNYFTLHNEHNLCGRLRQDQLTRPILQPTKPKFNNWYNKFLSLITGLLLSGPAVKAQHTKTENVNPIILSGKVIDADSKEKLIGANIVLTGNSYYLSGTSTDTEGNFKLKIDPKRVSEKGMVDISYTGYSSKQCSIEELKNGEPIALQAGVELPEIVVASFQTSCVKGGVRMGGIMDTTKVHGVDLKEAVTDDEIEKTQLPPNSINIYPNPFIDFITLELNWQNSEYILIRLTTIDGHEIFKKRQLTLAGQQSLDLNFPGNLLAAGSYIISIDNFSGELISEVIVKVGR